MKRRSVFADKLKSFDAFVLGDDAVTRNRGRWTDHFEARRHASRSDAQPSIAPLPAPTSSLLPPPPSLPLILEIGCFDGVYLAQIAKKHPAANFVGIDWKARPLYLGAEQIAPMGLANLTLLRGRAQDATSIFADGELDEIWLLHPEPCDREKERANRLMSARFLEDAHQLLRVGGVLVLKTDHAEYYHSTLALLQEADQAARFTTDCASADFWNDPVAIGCASGRAFAGEVTFYERRFLRRRQPIHYLQLVRR